MTEMVTDALEASFEEVTMVGATARPMLAGGDSRIGGGAFERFVRSGGGGLEMKAMSGASGGEGGVAVPREIDAIIDATLASVSPIRAIANVVKVGSAGYRKLVASGGTPSGWAAEIEARPETGTPTFNEIAPPMGDLYANPAASQAMLDDAGFDVESWLAEEVAREFARAEGAAFVGGSGVNRPKGFLAQPTAATGDGARPFGTLQTVASGAAGAFGENPEEKLIDLMQALRPPYRQGAVWVMNSATLARIRKFKTADGAFLWQAGLAEGQPATLLGHPVVEAEDMPDIAADSLSVAFGNFKAGYLIAERSETQVLRDPYSNKPFVHFYATALIDLIAHPAITAVGLDAPPVDADPGAVFIVGAAPTGDWSGKAGWLAGWSAAGWRFASPVEGMRCWSIADALWIERRGGAWVMGRIDAAAIHIAGEQVVGARQGPITAPEAGDIIDVEARMAINAILSALETHGLISTP